MPVARVHQVLAVKFCRLRAPIRTSSLSAAPKPAPNGNSPTPKFPKRGRVPRIIVRSPPRLPFPSTFRLFSPQKRQRSRTTKSIKRGSIPNTNFVEDHAAGYRCAVNAHCGHVRSERVRSPSACETFNSIRPRRSQQTFIVSSR
jgi:hypothetical protein